MLKYAWLQLTCIASTAAVTCFCWKRQKSIWWVNVGGAIDSFIFQRWLTSRLNTKNRHPPQSFIIHHLSTSIVKITGHHNSSEYAVTAIINLIDNISHLSAQQSEDTAKHYEYKINDILCNTWHSNESGVGSLVLLIVVLNSHRERCLLLTKLNARTCLGRPLPIMEIKFVSFLLHLGIISWESWVSAPIVWPGRFGNKLIRILKRHENIR